MLRSVLILAMVSSLGVGAPAPGEEFVTTSHYIPMRDGTRLAVDVHLPTDRGSEEKLPALLELTRYWRSSEDPASGKPNPAIGPLDRHFLEHGYAVVKVDVRGSGASFGTRPTEYGAQEVEDGFDVVEWVVAQPWSEGSVGAYGTSYTGTTAELLAAVGHPAVRAVIPGWSDFDVYLSPVQPYGLVAGSFIETWGAFVGWQDDNDASRLGASVRRVDEDADGALLAQAVAEHRANPDVFDLVSRSRYRDDSAGATRFYEVGPLFQAEKIQASGVPMLVLVSWLDAGTIDGALQRFRHFSNAQKLVIMATSHGGGSHASPFVVEGAPVAPTPSVEEQFELRRLFFDHYLKGEPAATVEVEAWPAVRYYNLGEEAFREADGWPPAPVRMRRFYPQAEGGLSQAAPEQSGEDLYRVDFSASTGETNRWTTQMGGPVSGLSDRGVMDDRMLTYTTAPLEADLQVTGAPVVMLSIESTASDGAVLAYLEDVDEAGRSRYVSEGGLRVVHRKPWSDPVYGGDGPLHSFRRGDSMPLVPGEMAEIRFRLWPTSVLFRKGHHIRLAIAGADADTFDRIPADGDVTLTIHRGGPGGSFLELPVIE